MAGKRYPLPKQPTLQHCEKALHPPEPKRPPARGTGGKLSQLDKRHT
jgi:hypothetical protein